MAFAEHHQDEVVAVAHESPIAETFVPALAPLHGIGCCADHTRVLLAEHLLNEAIENAHRTGLTASDT